LKRRQISEGERHKAEVILKEVNWAVPGSRHEVSNLHGIFDCLIDCSFIPEEQLQKAKRIRLALKDALHRYEMPVAAE
jgi:hypothetical protein